MRGGLKHAPSPASGRPRVPRDPARLSVADVDDEQKKRRCADGTRDGKNRRHGLRSGGRSGRRAVAEAGERAVQAAVDLRLAAAEWPSAAGGSPFRRPPPGRPAGARHSVMTVPGGRRHGGDRGERRPCRCSQQPRCRVGSSRQSGQRGSSIAVDGNGFLQPASSQHPVSMLERACRLT